GKLLAANTGNTLEVWEAATLHPVFQTPSRQQGFVAASLTPDGRFLALEKAPEGAIELWDVLLGKRLHRFAGKGLTPEYSAFSPDAGKLAMVAETTNVLVWELGSLLGFRPEPGPRLSEQDLARLWDDLAGRDAAGAFRAAGALRSVQGQAVSYLQDH